MQSSTCDISTLGWRACVMPAWPPRHEIHAAWQTRPAATRVPRARNGALHYHAWPPLLRRPPRDSAPCARVCARLRMAPAFATPRSRPLAPAHARTPAPRAQPPRRRYSPLGDDIRPGVHADCLRRTDSHVRCLTRSPVRYVGAEAVVPVASCRLSASAELSAVHCAQEPHERIRAGEPNFESYRKAIAAPGTRLCSGLLHLAREPCRSTKRALSLCACLCSYSCLCARVQTCMYWRQRQPSRNAVYTTSHAVLVRRRCAVLVGLVRLKSTTSPVVA